MKDHPLNSAIGISIHKALASLDSAQNLVDYLTNISIHKALASLDTVTHLQIT